MTTSLESRCVDLVQRLGIAGSGDLKSIKPMTGGVSSDIALVDLGDRRLCAKFALEKLRVAADWRASVDRNRAEYLWLQCAGDAVPGVAPQLFGRDDEANGFLMEYIDSPDTYVWKTALMQGQAVGGEAGKVAAALGAIHAASTAAEFPRERFDNMRDFHELRLEPYLEYTASVHPALKESLEALVQQQSKSEIALVHGDVSPKNILFRDGEAVILDAECATMGDPAFDVAFCLNHLFIKALHFPDRADELLAEATSFWRHYETTVCWELADELESRVMALLPALMLARVDGKSPVEYLSEPESSGLRELAVANIENRPASLSVLVRCLREHIKGTDS